MATTTQVAEALIASHEARLGASKPLLRKLMAFLLGDVADAAPAANLVTRTSGTRAAVAPVATKAATLADARPPLYSYSPLFPSQRSGPLMTWSQPHRDSESIIRVR